VAEIEKTAAELRSINLDFEKRKNKIEKERRNLRECLSLSE